ncbi:hypothetical protein MMC29_007196, partial [Sticta canariensis]|nr:hypothetical protein [Sticta canariensis]
VCDPATNFNLRPGYRGEFIADANTQLGSSVHVNIYHVQCCCTLGYHTPAYIAFHIQPDTAARTFSLLLALSNETPNDHLCPASIIELYDPFRGNYVCDYGLGLCGYLPYSDE